jgi:hypothetical protein
VKYLYILVFGLFSFAAPAQTLETWIPPHYLAEVDCFGETNQQGTKPSQIIGMEQFCAAMLNDAEGAAITDTQDAEDIPVGSLQPSKENSTVKYSTGSDDELAADDTTEQSATYTQIIVTKPTIQTLSEAKRDADGVPITEPEDAKGTPVGAVQPREANSTVKYSTGSDDELAVDDTTEQSATSTQIIVTKPTIQMLSEAKRDGAADVAITEPEDAEGILVRAVQPSEKNSTVKYSTGSDDELSLDDTAEPGATSPRIIASKPTIEYRDAKVSEVDDVMTTGPNHSENVQVGAHDDDPPTVGETIE